MSNPIISVANRKYNIFDVTFGDALALSRIEPKHHQKQLKTILYRITGSVGQVDAMTLEERYAVFLSYLDIAQFNSLDDDVRISDYLSPDLNRYDRERITNDMNYSLRPLMGIEAEALEIGCEDNNDWLIGEMALTMGSPHLDPIDTVTDAQIMSLPFIANIIKSRTEEIHKLSLDEFNILFAQYMRLKGEQKKLINYAFVDGVVLEKFEGGADDAPMRFRATASIHGYAKDFL